VVGYAEVWERFVRERRLEFGGHMDPDWGGGHALSVSLMIPVEASWFRARLEPLRDALRPFPLGEIEASARRAVSGFPAAEVRLANLNAFPGAAFIEVHDDGMLDRLREALCASCELKKPSGPPHLTLAYFQAPDGTPAPEELISAIAGYRDWDVGELAVERVEMTVLDLRLDYPEPEILAEMPLKRADQPVS
jgi:2'-5' RNA ligase